MNYLKKKLLNSYESTLPVEGREICKEVDSLISDDIDLIRENARTYCYFCTSIKRDAVDTKLRDKCEKYFKNLSNYDSIKYTFKHLRPKK